MTDSTSVGEVTPPAGKPGPAGRRNFGTRVFMVVALLVVVFGVIFSNRFGVDPTLIDSPLIGTEIRDLTLPFMEFDGEFSLEDARGDVLVVNFWASWCLPCRSEHPALLAAASEFADVDVRFIGILTQDDPANGTDFLDELGRGTPYTYVWDERSRAALQFGTLGVPETFFIDRGGVITGKVSGPINQALLSSVITDLLLGRTVGEITTGEVQNRE